ncbi:IGS10 protein, partial [Polypterus senegalus]|nr:IGS10 protein [Polypterus senegalus]
MKAIGRAALFLHWRFLALLCLYLKDIPISSACPKSCACYAEKEVHCTFRYFTSVPQGIQPTVERINLGYNSLSKIKENEFSGLRYLELLMLHSNAIETIEDKAFSDLQSLQVLKMSYNKVRELNKNTFYGLKNIVRLHMDHNKIEFINPETFYGLMELKLVHLEGNMIQQLHPDTFVTMRYMQNFKASSIKNIYLSDNNLRDLPSEIFAPTSQLESIYLHGNPWSCDCTMEWFVKWIAENEGILKCKRDRKYANGQLCPMCETPHTSKNKDVTQLALPELACFKPRIYDHLKQKNITVDEGDFSPVSSKNFIAPIGSMVLNMTDQSEIDASVACSVQRPHAINGVTVQENNGVTVLSASLSTYLVCNIDYEHIQQLWKILATYSDVPMKLERGLLLTKTPYLSYKYKQKENDEDVYSGIEAEVRADPAWLMQEEFTLQLDRATTTFTTLNIKYLSDIRISVDVSMQKSLKYTWTLIQRDNTTKTEHTALIGGTVELNCQAFGDPSPAIEWIFPDGSKVRAPYTSEDRRILISPSGKFTLRGADIPDAGLYRCIATNYLDADVLAFRITVLNPDVEDSEINGIHLSKVIGDTLILACGSVANPEATFNWVLPDQTVLDKSQGNKILYQNGTLGIQGLTERDRGFYRCLAANHYGADILTSQVLLDSTAINNTPSQAVVKHLLEEDEASGDEEEPTLQVSKTDFKELVPVVSNKHRQESRTITTNKSYPTKTRGFKGSSHRTNGIASNRRLGGNRRNEQFSQKIDTQRRAEFLHKIRKNNHSRNKMSKVANKIQAQNLSNLSEDDNEHSGELLTEDELLIMTTTTASNVLTSTRSTDLTTGTTIRYVENKNLITTATPLETESKTLRAQRNVSKTDIYVTESPLSQPYTVLPEIVAESSSEIQLTFSGEVDDNLKDVTTIPSLPSTARPDSTLPKTDSLPEIVNQEKTDSTQQPLVSTISTTEGDKDEITFHTTQKITSPRLPSGSTIISHQQIQIIRGDTSQQTANKSRQGKKRKLTGRRRIIRPNRIPDIQEFLYKIVKPNKSPTTQENENVTKSASIEITTKCECHLTDVPLEASEPETRYNATKTKGKEKDSIITGSINETNEHSSNLASQSSVQDQIPPKTTTSLKVGNDITFTEELQTSLIKTTTSSSPVTTRSKISIQSSLTTPTLVKPTQTKESLGGVTSKAKAETSTTSTTKTTTTSKVIHGKIPWHKLFGNKHTQKELLKRLKKPIIPLLPPKPTPSKTTTTLMMTPRPTTAIATIAATTILPSNKEFASPLVTPIEITTQTGIVHFSSASIDFSSGSSFTTEVPSLVNVLSSPSSTLATVIDRSPEVLSSAKVLESFTTEGPSVTKVLALPFTSKPTLTEGTADMETSALPDELASGSWSTTLQSSVKDIFTSAISVPSNSVVTTSQIASTMPETTMTTSTTTTTTVKPLVSFRRNGFRRRRPSKKITTTQSTMSAPAEKTVHNTTDNGITSQPAFLTTRPHILAAPIRTVSTIIFQQGTPGVKINTGAPVVKIPAKEISTKTPSETSKEDNRIKDIITTTARTNLWTSRSPATTLRPPKVQLEPIMPIKKSPVTFTPKITLKDKMTLKLTSTTSSYISSSTDVLKKSNISSRNNSRSTINLVQTVLPIPPTKSTRSVVPRVNVYNSKQNEYFTTTETDRKLLDGSGSYLTKPDIDDPTVSPSRTTSKAKENSLWQSQSWQELYPEATDQVNTLTMNALTVLQEPEKGHTKPPAIYNNDMENAISNGYGRSTFTTSKIVNFEPWTEELPSKPKIVGGNAASYTVLSNSDAFLPCEASGNPLPVISWTKVSTGTTVTMKAKRGNKFELFKNGTLSIQNVHMQDRGQYLCIAENQHGLDKLVVTLSVVAYPSRILEPKLRDIKSHSGNTIEMSCKAEGRPTPIISWILANRTLVRVSSGRVSMGSDGALTIKDVTLYDRGHYKCIASNPAGADTVTVRLQVVAAPPVILEEKRQYVKAEIGQNLKLPCTAKGDPQPTVHWVLFDATEARPLQYINEKLFVFSNGTLYIKNTAISDSGNYECIATSTTGSERRVVNMIVEAKDAVPRIVTMSDRRTSLNYGDRLLLNCSAVGEPKPRIIWRLPSKAVVDQWHRMGNRILVLPNGTLIIDVVSEKDAGDYLCVARNKIGDDLLLMKVIVTMKPAKIEYKQYVQKQVPFGKDLKVDCRASGAPEPEITWGLPDGTVVNSVLQADDSGRRSRRYVLFDNGTLYLNKVGMTEEGDYTCYAENTLGKDEMTVHITVVTAAPRIRRPSAMFLKLKAGGNVTVECEAIGEPKPKIMWLLPSNDMIAASSDRYLVHVNGSLTIKNVKLSDSGEYVCIARNSAGDDTKVFKLVVDGNPPIINGKYRNKTIVQDNAVKHSRKLIDCKAEGSPPPQIMWIMPDNVYLTAPYYGSRVVVHKNGTFEIRNVRATDSGEFVCVARNDGGETVMVVQLEVINVLRRPMFKNPFNEKILTSIGKTTILNCSVTGYPPPEIIWLLPNGTRFTNTQRMSRYHMGSDGTLIIYSSNKDDAGKYRCAARNKVGYIEKLIILEVGQKPYILTQPKGLIRSISGETLFLHCLSDGIPKPIVTWSVPGGYVLSRPQVNGKYILYDNGTLIVRETSIHDRGNYLCRAQNEGGEASITVPVIIIAYPPRITHGPPQSVRTRVGSSVHLNCIAIGIPKPEISWELPDHSVLSTAGKGRPIGSELLHPQGTLVIQKLSILDSGTYKCFAKNHLGSDSRITHIQVG